MVFDRSTEHGPDIDAMREQLRTRWPVRDFALRDGASVRVHEYPVVKLDRHNDRVVISGMVDGTVIGWRRDGFPIAVNYCRSESDPLTEQFVQHWIDKSGYQDQWLRIDDQMLIVGPQAPALLDLPRSVLAYEVWLRSQHRRQANAIPPAAYQYVQHLLAEFVARIRTFIDRGPYGFARAKFTPRQWHRLADGPQGNSWLFDQCLECKKFSPVMVHAAAEKDWKVSHDRTAAENLAWVLIGRMDPSAQQPPARSDIELVRRMLAIDYDRMNFEFFISDGSCPAPLEYAFRMLRQLPADWWPKSEPEMVAALRVGAAVMRLNLQTGLPVRQLADSCKGRWELWCDTLARLDPGVETMLDAAGGTSRIDVDALARGVEDMIDAFLAQIVLPLAERFVEKGQASALSFLPGRMALGVEWEQREAVAAALFGEATATGMIETAMKWHLKRSEIESQIARRSAEFSKQRKWKPGLPPWHYQHSQGRRIEMVVLSSQKMLADEGSKGVDDEGLAGLDHCVGGFAYVEASMQGTTRIVSVRERMRDGDGGLKRLSTAEFRRRSDGGFMMVQHRGFRNASPDQIAADAVYAYLRKIAGVGEKPAQIDLADFEPMQAAASLSEVCGYDYTDDAILADVLRLWEPLLRRPLRGLSPDEFVVAIGVKEQPGSAPGL